MVEIKTVKSKLSPNQKRCIEILSSILNKDLSLLALLMGILMDRPECVETRKEKNKVEPEMNSVIFSMVYAIGISVNTLVSLSKTPGLHTRDCYSIARSIIEASVNICYILSVGVSAAKQAHRHANQKAYKDLQREAEVAGLMIKLTAQSIPDPSSIIELDDYINEFTSRSGREKAWTDLSVDKRIAVAGEKFGDPILGSLLGARFAIYRHASEIMHGSYFGTLYFFGATTSSKKPTPESFSDNFFDQNVMILFCTHLCLASILEAFHLTYGYSKISEESKALHKEVGEALRLAWPEKTEKK